MDAAVRDLAARLAEQHSGVELRRGIVQSVTGDTVVLRLGAETVDISDVATLPALVEGAAVPVLRNGPDLLVLAGSGSGAQGAQGAQGPQGAQGAAGGGSASRTFAYFVA